MVHLGDEIENFLWGKELSGTLRLHPKIIRIGKDKKERII